VLCLVYSKIRILEIVYCGSRIPILLQGNNGSMKMKMLTPKEQPERKPQLAGG
jgi:hypothetical protein